MKFFCEYCGNRIDSEVDERCPHCGASYKKNKEFLKHQDEELKRKEQANEFREEITSNVIKGIKFSKWFLILPIFMFIVIITISSLTFGRIRHSSTNKTHENDSFDKKFEEESKKMEEEFNKIFKDDDEIEPVVVNGLNNYGNIEEYGFSVTGYEIVKPKWDADNKEGYECVKFYIQVMNTSDKEIHRQDVNCIVDGVAQTQSTFGTNTMVYSIKKGLTVKGEIEFIVPKNATSYDIRYGDYITIHIQK